MSRKVIDRSPRRLRPGVALTVRTADAAGADRLPGLAAEITFWVLLSLPALLLSLIAAFGFVSSRDGTDWQDMFIERIVEISTVALTERTIDGLVRPVLERLLEGGGFGVASFAFLASVWTASRAVKVVLRTVAMTYDRSDARTGWQDRLLGFGVTLAGLVVGVVLAPLLIAGPNFGAQLVTWIGEDPIGLEAIWRRFYFPAVIAAATMAIVALYHLGVPGRTPWRRDLPGAVLATTVWLVGSAALRLYGAYSLDGDSVYGPLAGPIVGLLWLWLSAFAVLLGAELNAQIERLWPTGGRPPSSDGDAATKDAAAQEQPVATDDKTTHDDRPHADDEEVTRTRPIVPPPR